MIILNIIIGGTKFLLNYMVKNMARCYWWWKEMDGEPEQAQEILQGPVLLMSLKYTWYSKKTAEFGLWTQKGKIQVYFHIRGQTMVPLWLEGGYGHIFICISVVLGGAWNFQFVTMSSLCSALYQPVITLYH